MEIPKPLQLFFVGILMIAAVETVVVGFRTLFVGSYAISVFVIGYSAWWTLINLAGDRRLHNVQGVALSVAGMVIACGTTAFFALRFYNLLQPT